MQKVNQQAPNKEESTPIVKESKNMTSPPLNVILFKARNDATIAILKVMERNKLPASLMEMIMPYVSEKIKDLALTECTTQLAGVYKAEEPEKEPEKE